MGGTTWYVGAAVACALYGLLVGLFVPALIGRIPEPDPTEPEQRPAPAAGAPGAPEDAPAAGAPAAPEAATSTETVTAEGTNAADAAEEPKELYADIASRRGLRWKAALACAVAAALVGGSVGPGPELSFLLYLVPVGVALAVIDWRTRLLPTKVVAPSYAVVTLLALLSAWTAGDWSSLATAAWGWLVAGGTFFVLWFVYPRGMGYGDVRLAGVLGIALGYLGWSELLTGVYAGFLLGGVGGLLLAWLRIVDRKASPFGPFMLVGALVGVLVGPAVGAWYV